MALKTDNPWQLFLFSAIGSCTAELSTVPIDVVKVRMQLQGELGSTLKYKSSLHAFPTIVQEEGIKGLYKGVQPALLRQATYGSIRIGMYEPIKVSISQLLGGGSTTNGPPLLLHKVLSGMVSGALSSAICNPTDVIKVRMQADGMNNSTPGAKPRYNGIVHAFSEIYKEGGIKGLYKGVGPTVQRASAVAAVELSSYDECKTLLVQWGWTPTGISTHLSASIMAGFLATIASSPFDVVKSRVMNQPVDAQGRGLRYSSTVDCFRKSIQAEGVLSLWKGFLPNFARLGPHCVVTFMVIEQLRNMFSTKKN